MNFFKSKIGKDKDSFKNYPASLVGIVLFFVLGTVGCGIDDWSDKKKQSETESKQAEPAASPAASPAISIEQNFQAHPYSALFGVWELDDESSETVNQLIKKTGDLADLFADNSLVYIGPESATQSGKSSTNFVTVFGIDSRWIKLKSRGPFLKKLKIEKFYFEVDISASLPIQISSQFDLNEIRDEKVAKNISPNITPLGSLEIKIQTGPTLPGDSITLHLKSEIEERSLVLRRSSINSKTGKKEQMLAQLARFDALHAMDSAKVENSSVLKCPVSEPGFKLDYWHRIENFVRIGDTQCLDAFVKHYFKEGGKKSDLVVKLLIPLVANSGGANGYKGNTSWATLNWAIEKIKFLDPSAFFDDRYASINHDIYVSRYELWGRAKLWDSSSSAMVRGRGQMFSFAQIKSLLSDDQKSGLFQLSINNLALSDMFFERVLNLRWEMPNSKHLVMWEHEPFYLLATTLREGLIRAIVKDLKLSSPVPNNSSSSDFCDNGGLMLGYEKHLNLEKLQKAVIVNSHEKSRGGNYECQSPTRVYYSLLHSEPIYLIDERFTALIELGLVPKSNDYYFRDFISKLGEVIFQNEDTIKSLWRSSPDMLSDSAMEQYRTGSKQVIEKLRSELNKVETESNKDKTYFFQNILSQQVLLDRIEQLAQTHATVERIVAELKAARKI